MLHEGRDQAIGSSPGLFLFFSYWAINAYEDIFIFLLSSYLSGK
jgi:hypothetical protein